MSFHHLLSLLAKCEEKRADFLKKKQVAELEPVLGGSNFLGARATILFYLLLPCHASGVGVSTSLLFLLSQPVSKQKKFNRMQ